MESQPGEKKVGTIGVIGCGLIADTHIEAICDALPGTSIAVCDPLPGKAELLRRQYNLKAAYTRIDDMLSIEHPLAVHVLSPPQFHIAHAKQCLSAGCHVLVEKPLCFSAGEARDLYHLSRSLGLALCVDHSLLFQPSVARMMSVLKKDPRVRVVHVNSYYGLDGEGMTRGSGIQPWKKTIPGGMMMDAVVHPVSLAVALTGKPSRVHANHVMKDGQITELHVSWETESGVVGITVSADGQPFRRATEVVTSAMSFVVEHSTEVLVTLPITPGPRAVGKLVRNISYGRQLKRGTLSTVWQVACGRIKQNPGARGLVKAFYESLEGKAENPVTEANVIDTVQALEDIIQAIEASTPAVIPTTAPVDPPRIQVVNPSIRTLVTGASGFLGRSLCEQLASEGRRSVIALTRRGANAEKLLSSHLIEKRFVDLRYFSPQDYDTLLQGVSEVVHCAHASGAKTWKEYQQQNVSASIALFEAAAKAGCRKFIHISSVAVHGVHDRRSNIISEETLLSKGRSVWDFYIRSKSQADAALHKLAKTTTLPLLVLRPGILYSADGQRLAGKSIPLAEGRLLIEFGGGKNHQPFTRVDVLARTILHALNADSFPRGAYLVTGRMTETAHQFRKVRMDALGIKCTSISVPTWPFRPIAAGLELLFWLTGRSRPPKLTRYILDSECRDLLYDCTKAERELGWSSSDAVAYDQPGKTV